MSTERGTLRPQHPSPATCPTRVSTKWRCSRARAGVTSDVELGKALHTPCGIFPERDDVFGRQSSSVFSTPSDTPSQPTPPSRTGTCVTPPESLLPGFQPRTFAWTTSHITASITRIRYPHGYCDPVVSRKGPEPNR